MKVYRLFSFFTIVIISFTAGSGMSHSDLEEWENFKAVHKRKYDTEEEHDKRKALFMESLRFVQEHNAKHAKGETSFTVAINKFADMSKEEMDRRKRRRVKAKMKTKGKTFISPSNPKMNSSVDWRALGAVTPVRDQGSCQCCWAISSVGSLESQNFLAGKKLVPLSVQSLIDCSRNDGNDGCGGGYQTSAFQYLASNQYGVVTETAYPFAGKSGACKHKAEKNGVTISSYIQLTPGNERELQEAVATVGPISVSIDYRSHEFHKYHSGVFDHPKCKTEYDDLDHAALVVGYGTYNGLDYWLVKNSWGTDWGMDGYIMMSRNKNNQCGIATDASYPVL